MRQKMMVVAGVIAAGAMLAGCSGETTANPSSPGAEQVASPSASATEPSDSGDAGSDDLGVGVAVDEVRDGLWQVGDAGEVNFTADGGSLSLGKVKPADGWEHRVADDKADEIEVHFVRGDQEWKFEVELEKGTMQISKELKIANASSGSYSVGNIATLDFRADGDAFTVENVQHNDGWPLEKTEEDSDSVEVSFKMPDGAGSAEFEAERDAGVVTVEISQKLRRALG